jgi:hypothetical protein
MVYNIPDIKVENTAIYVKSEIIPRIKAAETVVLTQSEETPAVSLFGIVNKKKSNDIKSTNLNEMIVYKVQVGAFAQTINVNEFHGLVPLTEDRIDQKKYTKYMVGEYFSYKAATEAKRIIVCTTRYSDAFVVAYKNGKRVVIDEELLNLKERSLSEELK